MDRPSVPRGARWRVAVAAAVVFVAASLITCDASAQCPPTDYTYLGLQVGAYADGQPKGQQANVTFLARYELTHGRAAAVVERRFCLWPRVAAEVETALTDWLRAPSLTPETLWTETRESWGPPWWSRQSLTIEGHADRVRLVFPEISTNGLAAGDDTMAAGSLAVDLAPGEVAVLVRGLADWRAAPSCRPLLRLPQ